MARLRLVLYGLCVVVAVMFVALLLLREDAGVSDSPRSPSSGALLPTGIRAPDFRLTAQMLFQKLSPSASSACWISMFRRNSSPVNTSTPIATSAPPESTWTSR